MKTTRFLELLAALLFGLLLVSFIKPHVDHDALRWTIGIVWCASVIAWVIIYIRKRRRTRSE